MFSSAPVSFCLAPRWVELRRFTGRIDAEKEPDGGGEVTPTITALSGIEAVKNILTMRATRRQRDPRDAAQLAMTPVSMTNCQRMSRWRAPSDLRMPISWVRSVTLASMMFMMTIPPTTMKTATSPMVTAKIVPVRFFHALIKVSEALTPKVSSSRRDVAAGAHQGSDFVFQFHHVRPSGALMKTSSSGGHPDTAEGGERHDREVVLALSERAARLSVTPMTRKGRPARRFLFQRIHIGEKLVHQVRADDANAGVVLVVGIIEVAALFTFSRPISAKLGVTA